MSSAASSGMMSCSSPQRCSSTLSREAHAAHHAQRVVGESDVGVERCAYNAVLEVVDAVERVYEFAEARLVKAYRHGVDGEVAAVLVVLECAVLNHGLARTTVVALAACAHELHLRVVELNLRRTEVAVYGEMSAPASGLLVLAQRLLQRLRHLYAAAHDDDVDVVRGALEEYVAHIAAHEIAFYAHLVGHFAYLMEYLFVENLCQFGICV